MRAVSRKHIYKNDIDERYFFEQAIRLCLNNDRDIEKILQNFIQSFVNENNLDTIVYGVLKYFGDEYSGPVVTNADACSIENGVYFKSNIFKRKIFTKSVILLFHELEHCKTFFNNSNNSVLRGEEYLNFIGMDKPYSSMCLYYTSENEHNSRMAEIKYLEKFVDVLEDLLNKEPELRTSQNEKILKTFKSKLKKHTVRLNNRYQNQLKKKNSPKIIAKVKNLANDALKLFKSNELEQHEDEVRTFSYIMDYLIAYKDETFAEEILQYIKESKNSFLWDNVYHIFNSGAIKVNSENIDKIIFKYSCFGPSFLNLINGEDLAKHNLLFHGKAIIDSATGRQIEESRSFCEKVKNLNFNGIAIRFEDFKYCFEIDGKRLEFQTATDALVALCDYVNITFFDDLTVEKITQLNAMLGEKIITNLKVKDKQETNPKLQSEINDSVDSNYRVERIGVERAREESIVLIGPIGAGKSLLSSELSKRNNLPVITTDIMRHCPRTIEEIRKQQARVRQDIEYWKNKFASSEDLKQQEEIRLKINKLKNDEWVCDRQIQMRTLLPNLPNYDDLGCDTETSNFLRKKFGLLACHYYEKQFENQLLQALSQQIDFACIVDMGGCMSISLDEEYAKLDKQFREIDEQLYLKHFDLTKYSFPLVEKAIRPFQNIVELQLPEDYKTTMQRAGDSIMNDYIIKSGQNHQLATRTIQVLGHIKGNKVDWEQVRALCEQIEQPASQQVETTLTQN